MTTQKLFFLFLVSFITIHNYSQSTDEYCEKWNRQMDTLVSLESRLTLSQQMVSKVEGVCKTQIYLHLGRTYDSFKKIDSSNYFYDKAIALGEAQGEIADEYLGYAYVSKAYNLIDDVKEEEKAQVFIKKAKVILDRNPDHKAWKIYYNYYGVLAENKADYTTSIKYIDSTIIFSKRIKDTSGIASSYQDKGFYKYNLSDYEGAIKDLLYSIELNKKKNNINVLAGGYYILSACYLALDNNEIAIKYAKKGVEVSKQVKSDFTASLNYSILSESYRNLNQIDDALKATDSAIAITKRLNYDVQTTQALTDKAGIYYISLKKYDEAEKYFLEAYEIAESLNIDIYMGPIIDGLVGLYIDQKEDKKAHKYLKKYEILANKINQSSVTLGLYDNYSQYYEKTGQPTLALEYIKKYHTIKDSIASVDVKTQVADLEKKYDTKTKELDIVTLTKEKEEQELVVQKAKTQQTIYLLIAGFLLVILAIGFWAFRKLRKQQQELTSTNQVKNRLFSIIAHDLRGMIIPFQRSGKILNHHIEKGNYEKTIELSKALEQNSESLSNMLDNLLNWSLQQMDGYRMNAERISVKDELGVIIAMYEQQALFKNTNIELVYEKNLWINFDKGAFNVIFRNLIGNALKYTEEGNIRIAFNNEFDVFLCTVTDTGIGMSQDQVNSLFTLDANTSTTGTKGEKGTGLGLNLIYRFIKMHSGVIDVFSEKRMGTRFEMKIPAIISNNEDLETSDTLSA